MPGRSRLTISRQVLKTAESTRFTAKVNHFAQETFGHDGATLTAGQDGFHESAGNPRFKVLQPLELFQLYRAGRVDSRNRASSSGRAAEALAGDNSFNEAVDALEAKYDGLDFSRLAVTFCGLALGSKPGYLQGETQVLLVPDPSDLVTSYLIEEAQLCSGALSRISIRNGNPETPVLSSIPLIKLDDGISSEERSQFAKKIQTETLPITLELGARELDGQDGSKFAI